MKLPNKVYDKLKWIVMILLPALSTLYFALSEIWGLPCAAQVCGTISVIATFLGTLVGISTHNYYKNE